MEPVHKTAVLHYFLFHIYFDFNRELLQYLRAAPSFIPCPLECHTKLHQHSSPKVCRQFVPFLALLLAEVWISVSSHLPCPILCSVGGEWIHDGGNISCLWRYQVSS